MPPTLEGLDNDHAATTTWAWRVRIYGFVGSELLGIRGDVEELTSESKAGLADGTGEQAIMPDAVEAARQDVEQEAADKFVGRDHHDALAKRKAAIGRIMEL